MTFSTHPIGSLTIGILLLASSITAVAEDSISRVFADPSLKLHRAADRAEIVSQLRTIESLDHQSDPEFLVFSYRPDESAIAAGAQAVVRYSSNLTDWTAALHDGVNVFIDDSIDGVEVRVRRSLAVDDKLFLKLEVAMPTP